MDIQIKLMGVLKEMTPESGRLHLPDGASIGDVLVSLKIPVDDVQVFTVNEQLVLNRGHILQPGDELTVIPPVAGG